MNLVLLHGIEIFAFFGGTFLGVWTLLGMLAFIAAKREYYKYISIGYFLIGTAILIACEDPVSYLSFLLFYVTAFPWSLLIAIFETFFAPTKTSETTILVFAICGVLINAAIFFLFGRYLLKGPDNAA